MVNPTLSWVALGNVESIMYSLDKNIIPIPYEGASSTTETWDILGATRIITVMGVFTGVSVSAVKTQVDAVLAVINTNQESSVLFDSDELGTGGSALSVKISTFDVTWDTPNNKARYSLKMIEGIDG